MNFLLTGTPGSGKTALVDYANSLGDNRFVDADGLVGLCEWREFDSGKVLGSVEKYKAPVNSEANAWYKKYGWHWKTDFLNKYISENPNSIICGSSENIVDCYRYFDKIFILKKTEAELLSNVLSPGRTNPFGKTPEQRKGFMEWQNYLIKESLKHKPIIIEGNVIADTYEFLLKSI
jgi:hypothetical protein